MEYKNELDKQYLELMRSVFATGYGSDDRTGTGTIKTFGNSIKVNLQDGFPILTSKKVFTKAVIYELLWFLSGETNMKLMTDNDVNIWIGDAYKKYCEIEANPPHDHTLSRKEFIDKLKADDEFCNKWGDLGRVYGVQWRNWKKHRDGNVETIDQVQNVLDKLRTNPDDRRMVVTAWNPGELDQQLLPPCHYFWQVFTRELSFNERVNFAFKNNMSVPKILNVTEDDRKEWYKFFKENNIPERAISLSFNMRSVDVPLGMPFDISSYGFLLSMIAQQVNMMPENLVCNFGDTHIYQNQIGGVKEQLKRKSHKLPELKLNKAKSLFDYKYEDFELIDYICEDKINFPLSN